MANAKEIVDSYAGGPVGREQMNFIKAALDFFVSIQPASDDPDGGEKYRLALAEHADTIKRAKVILRALGEGIDPQTLEAMQHVYYGIVGSRCYNLKGEDASCVRSILSRAWDGIGPWQD